MGTWHPTECWRKCMASVWMGLSVLGLSSCGRAGTAEFHNREAATPPPPSQAFHATGPRVPGAAANLPDQSPGPHLHLGWDVPLDTVRERGPRVPILEYHDITYIPHDPWAMSPSQFAEEMKYLHDNQFHVMSLDELYAVMQGRASLPARPVVITFDDGYESNYTNAFPILKQYRFPATIFMISGFVGRSGFLTKDQLLTMANSGLIEVESHTVD
ncbi:MAG: polysaccharide deacetylase family protein, partial [Alicyclobacillus sp.]|nr:polysaccharide deacetylase family protein [Alicyclobacillus sp.]